MARYCRKRLVDPRMFDKASFRTIPLGKEGKKGIIGCPKGYWKRSRCKIGTRLQSILYPEGSKKCLVGGKELNNPVYLNNDHLISDNDRLKFIILALRRLEYDWDDINEYLKGLGTKGSIERAYLSLEKSLRRRRILKNPKKSKDLSKFSKIKFIVKIYRYKGWSDKQIRDLLKMLVDLNFVDKYYKMLKKVYKFGR